MAVRHRINVPPEAQMFTVKAVGLGTATALAALLAGAPVAAAAPDTARTLGLHHHRVLRLEAKTVDEVFIPVTPTSGLTLGARTVFNQNLFDERNDQVGHAGGVCTITRVDNGGEAECVATFDLSEGQLSFQGLIKGFLNGPFSFDQAVTGGTGDFDRARGMLHADPINGDEHDQQLTIDLDF